MTTLVLPTHSWQPRIDEAPPATVSSEIRLSEVIAALSYALDITEGQPEGHAARSCLIGMRLADVIGLPHNQRSALFYALLLKDLGCSSNAAKVAELFGSDDIEAKRDMKLTNWSHLPTAAMYGMRHLTPGRPLSRKLVQFVKVGMQGGPLAARPLFAVRCDRGAAIALMLDFPPATAEAIRALDEHWDGNGYPFGLRGEAIPLLGRIVCLAQTVEIFFRSQGLNTAYAVVEGRRGTWFDPALVTALQSFRNDYRFWSQICRPNVRSQVTALEPEDRVMLANHQRLDQITAAFAQVIDAKSPWTFRHSEGVADLSVGIADQLGLNLIEQRELRRAALLHDIGKLGISNQILDKPGPLNDAERDTMRRHPIYTLRLLERVASFRDLAGVAAAHHERLDGKGYPWGLRAAQLPLAARILATADLCDALAADRPYRAGMAPDQILEIARREVGSALDADCVAALEPVLCPAESHN